MLLGLNSGTTLNLGTIGTILSAPGAGTLVIGTSANAGTLMPGGSTANTAGELLFINNSGNDQVLNTSVGSHGTGVTTVTKSGSGRLVVNGSGFYSGGIFVNGGTLLMGTATALGTSTAPTVNAGASRLQAICSM